MLVETFSLLTNSSLKNKDFVSGNETEIVFAEDNFRNFYTIKSLLDKNVLIEREENLRI